MGVSLWTTAVVETIVFKFNNQGKMSHNKCGMFVVSFLPLILP